MDKRKRLRQSCFDPFQDTKPRRKSLYIFVLTRNNTKFYKHKQFEFLFLENKNTNDLRKFPESHLWKFPTADETSVLCSVCRKRVAQYEPPVEEELSSQTSNLTLTPDDLTSCSQATVSNFSDTSMNFKNHTLETFLNVSPIQKRRFECHTIIVIDIGIIIITVIVLNYYL